MPFQPFSSIQLPSDNGAALVELHRAVEELMRAVESLHHSFYKVETVEPARREENMIRFADGVLWNPGAGRGLYQWHGGIWNKL